MRLLALAVPLLALSWLLMQAVHEQGHMLHAHWADIPVTRVILHPLGISETVLMDDTTRFVAWGGPLWGVALPLMGWGLATIYFPPAAATARFFAGFCLVANGVYLGVGAFHPVGDAADLLRLGASRGELVLFALLTVPSGFALWNGQGPHFGWSARPTPATEAPPTQLAIVLWIALASTLAALVYRL